MENELRSDYFLDRQVIISVGRGKRPNDFLHMGSMEAEPGKSCFFCPGNENMTPPEISRVEEGGNWVMRVFPNKFPAVTPEGGEATGSMMPAYGRHEVVVETPEHGKTIGDLAADRVDALLGVYAQRIEALLSDNKAKYVLAFKNHGRAAGASLSHTHTQIISLPVVPKLVRDEVDAAKRYGQDKGSCPFCDIWRKEGGGARAVWEDGNVSAFAPYASRTPFEVWVMPKRHVRSLSDLSGPERASFAEGLRRVLSRLKTGLNDPPYNFYLHASPGGGDLHLHLEVLPKLATWAGFELGSNIIINTMPPESAAEFYRTK